MDANTHRRVTDLFSAAVELPKHERTAYLDRECTDDAELRAVVERMLAADEDAPSIVDANALDEIETAPASRFAELTLPYQLDGYRLIELLGSGGMASVFLAEQESPRRKVAVKLLDRGLTGGAASADALARFRLEADLLARLQHPHIAQIYETGFTQIDGIESPFFAMEMVEGRTLDRTQLRVDERTRLAIEIAEALQHAHQKGVLHRDLKPSNILVDRDGRAKVVDFGIGRLIEDRAEAGRTQQGVLLGTLAYMSPEQADGRIDEIDARTDVYGLGATLYELFTGAPPFDIEGEPLTAALVTIRDRRPAPADSRANDLPKDLATVLAKCLEKEPDRRYPSADAVADELRRIRRHQPIQARPATLGYTLSRFVRRNRAVSVATVIALLAVIAGTTSSVLWAIRASESAEEARRQETAARRAETEARAELQTTQGIVTFVEDLFRAGNAQLWDGEELTAKQLLDVGRRDLARAFPDESWAGARIEAFFASLMIRLGDYESARKSIERAAPRLAEAFGPDDPVVLKLRVEQARLEGREDPAAAIASLDGILEQTDEERADHLSVRQEAERELGLLHKVRQEFDEAEQHLKAALELAELSDSPVVATAQIQLDLAGIYDFTDRGADSERLCRSILESPADQLPRLLRSRAHEVLGVRLFRNARGEEAVTHNQAALDLAMEVVEADHPLLVQLLLNLAANKASLGALDEAEPMFERSVQIARTKEGVPPESKAQALQNLGNCFASRGEAQPALDLWEEALEIWVELAGADSMPAASLYASMAWAQGTLGNTEKAQELGERAQRIRGGR